MAAKTVSDFTVRDGETELRVFAPKKPGVLLELTVAKTCGLIDLDVKLAKAMRLAITHALQASGAADDEKPAEAKGAKK